MPSPETANLSGHKQAETLNQRCVCVTLDRAAVARKLASELHESVHEILTSTAWEQLFSDTALFVSSQDLAQINLKFPLA